MHIVSIILSLLALVSSVLALFFSLRSRGPTPILSAQRPGIRGDIKITNDCSGRAGDIPTHVKISGKLYDDSGNSVGDVDTVGPLGVDPNNPIKRGTYYLNVTLPPNWGTTTEWKVWITRTNGRDICGPINSCAVGSNCVDQVSKPYVVAFTSWALTKEIKVACSCV